jgi:hypothetical protein
VIDGNFEAWRGQFKEWKKSAERWRPEFHGYVSIGSKGTLKVMVWRSIIYCGVDTLVIADGLMNSERYIHVDVLDYHLLKYSRLLAHLDCSLETGRGAISFNSYLVN